MTKWERWILYAANFLVAGTGVVYAIMRYLMEPADEWAVVNHPWQPHVQHLHVLTAPLLVFACGLIWHRHVAGNLRRNKQRGHRSGPGLVLTFVPMLVSGYLIQTTVAESWRQVWIFVHVTSSAAWILGFAGHLVSAYRTRPRQIITATMRPRRTQAPDRVHQPAASEE